MRSRGAGRRDLIAALAELAARPPDRRALGQAAERVARAVPGFAGMFSLVDPARPVLAGRRDRALVDRILERVAAAAGDSSFVDHRSALTVRLVHDRALRAAVDARRERRDHAIVLGGLLFERDRAAADELVRAVAALLSLWLGKEAAALELTGRQRALELGQSVSGGLLEESGSALGLDRLLERMRGIVPCDALSVALPVGGGLHAIHVMPGSAPDAFADAVAAELAAAVGAERVRDEQIERVEVPLSAVPGVRPRRVGSSLVLELPDPGGGAPGYLALCAARAGTLQPRHLRMVALVVPWLAGALAGAASVRAERREARARRDEIDRACTIQAEMGPARRALVDVEVAFRSSAVDGLSGDVHDVVTLPDGSTGIFIGDVCGHGVPAALVSSFIRGVLVSAWSAAGPAELLQRVHEALRGRASSSSELMFVTACAAVFCPREATLTLAIAGHPTPVLGARGAARPLEAEGGPPLGVTDSCRWPEARQRLEREDTVLFFTDGLAETLSEDLIARYVSRRTAESIVEEIERGARSGSNRADDRTVIALRVL